MIDDSDLLHARVYNAARAREYYLRTRKLKGRRPGAGDKSPSGRRGPSPPSAKRSKGSSSKSLGVEKAALEARLDHLRDALAQLVKVAKGRSGVKPKDDDPRETADRNERDKRNKPMTAKQKKAQSERSKKNYEENKKPGSPSTEIEVLQEQIKDIRAKIKAAIEDARKKSGKSNPQTASKGR